MTTRKHLIRNLLMALPLYAAMAGSPAHAQSADPMDLLGFKDESYGSVQPQLDVAASWSRVSDFAVLQAANGNPTLAYSDFNVMDQRIVFDVQVSNVHENDFFGVAIGYQQGDVSNPQADYLLVDWKRSADAPVPQFSVQGGVNGLNLSRVTGVPDLVEFFDHSSLDAAPFSPASGVTELSAGATLGQQGWEPLISYTLELEVRENSLKVLVDGQLEIDHQGPVPSGRMAFYGASQPGITFSNLRVESLPPEQQRPHTIFITSERYTQNLGGLAGADATCQAQADAAGLSGSYRAILSDSSQDARDRIAINGPIIDTRGNVIADNEAGLWSGTLLNPLRFDADTAPRFNAVWTGTRADGTANDKDQVGIDTKFCNDWFGTDVRSAGVETGRPFVTDSTWVSVHADTAGFTVCGLGVMNHLYCIDSDI